MWNIWSGLLGDIVWSWLVCYRDSLEVCHLWLSCLLWQQTFSFKSSIGAYFLDVWIWRDTDMWNLFRQIWNINLDSGFIVVLCNDMVKITSSSAVTWKRAGVLVRMTPSPPAGVFSSGRNSFSINCYFLLSEMSFPLFVDYRSKQS